MAFLALDTSGNSLSVVLLKGTSVYPGLSEQVRNAENTMRIVEKVIGDAGISFRELEAIAVASGPGSYTGLRNGISTAQGISVALKLPIYSVPLLIARAQLLAQSTTSVVVPFLKAREGERYCVGYSVNSLRYEEMFSHRTLSEQSFEDEVTTILGTDRFVFVDVSDDKLDFVPALAIAKAATSDILAPVVSKFADGDPVDALYIKPVQARTLAERRAKL